MISKTVSIHSRFPKLLASCLGLKRIQAYKLGVQEVDGRAVAPLDWVTPPCVQFCLWGVLGRCTFVRRLT